jgi:putative ABC transport system ATP-binding protein
LAGVDLTAASRAERTRIRRRTVTFIFQSFNLFPALTALENVQFGADVAGRAHPGRVAAQVLEQVGLAERGEHFTHQLSGGEQQRVATARALATGNPILLADEPTGELDFRTGVLILELLRAQAEAGKTVIVVTHNREISRVADRVIELSSGHIVADGPPPRRPAAKADLHW